MKIISLIFILIFVACVAQNYIILQSCDEVLSNDALPSKNFSKQFNIDQLNKISFVVNTPNAYIDISMMDVPRIEVQMNVRAKSEEILNLVDLDANIAGNSLQIQSLLNIDRDIINDCPTSFIRIIIPQNGSLSLIGEFLAGILRVTSCSFNDLNLYTVSGGIYIEDVDAVSSSLTTVSGMVDIRLVEIQNVNIRSNSGPVSIRNSIIDRITSSVIAGSLLINNLQVINIVSESSSGRQIFRNIYFHPQGSIRAFSISGVLEMSIKRAPKFISSSSTSGSTIILLPSTYSGILSVSTISGMMQSRGFENRIHSTTPQSGVITFNGRVEPREIRVDTISGMIILGEFMG